MSRAASARACVSKRRSSMRPAKTRVAPARSSRALRSRHESSTALSSTSRILDHLQNRLRIGERREERVRMVARKLLGRVAPRGDRDRARTDGLPALDVRRRVADDEDAIAGNFQPELFLRPALREARKLTARVMIRSEGTHAEAIDVDARRLELDRGARAQISGEQSEHDIAACLQPIEQLPHPVEHVRSRTARELAL